MNDWFWLGVFFISFTAHAAQSPSDNDYPYVIKDDTVYQKKTGLTWKRCSVGQQWNEQTAGCVGVAKMLVLDAARQQGDGAWRLPTRDELASLIDQNRKLKKEKPTIDVVAFPDITKKSFTYWSSTPAGLFTGWIVQYGTGEAYGDVFPGMPFAVRLVRSGNQK